MQLIRYVFALLVLTLSSGYGAYALTINLPAGFVVNGSTYVLNVIKGSPVNVVDFDFTPAAATNQVWEISNTECTSCPPNAFSLNTTNGVLNFKTDAEYTLKFKLVVAINDESEVASQDIIIKVSRQAVDYALVLDQSGSMEGAFDGSWPAPDGKSRWDGLVKAVSMLAIKIDAFKKPGDAVGIRYFETTAHLPTKEPFNGGLVDLATHVGKISGEVDSLDPLNLTALGDGMLSGATMLTDAGTVAAHKKVMFIFSDGVQNAGDEVDYNNPKQTKSGKDLNGLQDQISFYTVCLGSTGSNPDLLSKIAGDPTRFRAISSFPNEIDSAALMAAFDAMVNKILEGASPQFVGVRNGQFRYDSSNGYNFIEKFEVNKDVEKVFIVMATEKPEHDRFASIKLNGEEIRFYGEENSGPGFRTITFNFPLIASNLAKKGTKGIGGTPPQNAGGTWVITGDMYGGSLTARNGSTRSNAYYLSLTVDDHKVDINYSLGNTKFHTGQTIRPAVTLKFLNNPVKNASATAIFLPPGVDIGNLLALAGGSYNDADTTDPGSIAEQKLSELLKDSATAAKIKARVKVVDLQFDAASGKYTGAFNGLDVSGVYQVIFLTEATGAFGQIVRFDQSSFSVQHEDVDLARSGITITTNPNGQTVITFRPQTSQGIFWGPGWAGGITVNFPDTRVDTIIDKGDGTYQIIIAGRPNGNGTITIGDATVFKGNASALNCFRPDLGSFGKLKCWLLAHPWVPWVLGILLLLLLWWLFRKRKK